MAQRPSVMEFLLAWDRPWPPSVREIAQGCGVVKSTVSYHLRRLRHQGLVAYEPRTYRTVRALSQRPHPIPGSGMPFEECVREIRWEPGRVVFSF